MRGGPMRELFRQIVSRPAAAVTAGFELLGQRMKSGQRIDGIVSRIIHTLSRAPGGSDNVENQLPPFVAEQQQATRVEAATEAQSEAFGASRDDRARTSGGQSGSEESGTPVASDATSQGYAHEDTDLCGEMLHL